MSDPEDLNTPYDRERAFYDMRCPFCGERLFVAAGNAIKCDNWFTCGAEWSLSTPSRNQEADGE